MSYVICRGRQAGRLVRTTTYDILHTILRRTLRLRDEQELIFPSDLKPDRNGKKIPSLSDWKRSLALWKDLNASDREALGKKG